MAEKKNKAESPIMKFKKVFGKKAKAEFKDEDVEQDILNLNDEYFEAKLAELKEPDRKLDSNNKDSKRMSQIVKFTNLFKDEDEKHVVPGTPQKKQGQSTVEKINIKSKLAQYYIIDTYFLRHNTVPLLDIIERWQTEVKEVLTPLYHQATQEFKSKQQQADYFAVLCAQHLFMQRGSSVSGGSSCPLSDTVWNFILPLVQGHKCLCMCYATYIRAAAEEFEFDNMIYLCNEKHHSSIIVVDEYLIDRYKITEDDVRKFSELDVPDFVKNKRHNPTNPELRVISIGDELSIARVRNRINMNFKDGVQIDITARIKQNDTEQQNVLDLKILPKSINRQLKRRIHYVDTISALCDRTFLWNDEVTLITRITTRRDLKSMYMRLICMGYVYSNSEYSFVDLVDYMLLVHLMQLQRLHEYDRLLQNKISHDYYDTIQIHLIDLLSVQIDQIYEFILDKTDEPFSVLAIMSAINNLTMRVRKDIIAKRQAEAATKSKWHKSKK